MKTNTITHIHRFHDTVAVSFEGQPTVYLTEQHAWDVGNALKDCAAELSQNKDFSKSKFPTQTIES